MATASRLSSRFLKKALNAQNGPSKLMIIRSLSSATTAWRREAPFLLSSSKMAASRTTNRSNRSSAAGINHTQQQRSLSFSFAGPRSLNDVLKTELLQDKTGPEIADLWFTYHETKDDVVGLVLSGDDGKAILERAATCPYFVQPVFRDDGFFMLLSEFQAPSHFLMAYLEDYKMDPNSATPLLTFSVFDDYSQERDIALVRCDILNKNINEQEARKVVQSLLDNYRQEVDFGAVKTFNERPNAFDFDDHIARMNDRWSQDNSTGTTPSSTSTTI